jgi:hypothetical protein
MVVTERLRSLHPEPCTLVKLSVHVTLQLTIYSAFICTRVCVLAHQFLLPVILLVSI